MATIPEEIKWSIESDKIKKLSRLTEKLNYHLKEAQEAMRQINELDISLCSSVTKDLTNKTI